MIENEGTVQRPIMYNGPIVQRPYVQRPVPPSKSEIMGLQNLTEPLILKIHFFDQYHRKGQTLVHTTDLT